MGKPVNKTLRIAAMSAGEEIGHVSGPIVTFRGNGDPLRSLLVAIDPVQDLHGYDSPWPAGGGKNLFDKDAVEMNKWIDVNTTTISPATGYAVTDYMPVTQGQTYYSGAKGSVRSAYYDTNKNGIAYFTYVGGSSFTAEHTGFVRFTLYAVDMPALLSTLQFEKGSTATPYAPYSNICPISGWSAVNVWRTGKNLTGWVPGTQRTSAGVQYTVNADGSISCVGTATASTWGPGDSEQVMLKPGTYVATIRGNTNIRLAVVNDSVTPSQQISLNAGVFTLTQDTLVHAYISGSNGVTFNETVYIQIELGSAATAYEPYQGETYSITFPSEAGTVYGGTLDVTTGKLTVDKAMVDLGTLTWSKVTSTQGITMMAGYPTGITTGVIGVNSLACSVYKAIPCINAGIATDAMFPNGSVCQSVGGTSIRVRDDSYTDATTFKTAMSGVQLVYELATPITIQLTPTEISTLQGQNNVWADSGDVDVEYIATGGEGGKLALLLRNRKELLIALRKGLSPAEAGLLGSIPSFGGSLSPGVIRPGLNTQEEEEDEKDDA